MENQETWEPTLPSGYTLYPEAAYGGRVSTHLTQGPAYPDRWPPSDTSAATTLVAAAAMVALTLKSKWARRASGSRSTSGGTGGGGGNSVRGSKGIEGSGKGSEERLNAIAYNNAYVEGMCGLLRHAGAMQLITRKASLAGIEIPVSPVELNCKS